MHIADIETFVVANPNGGDRGGYYFILVRLTTDGGVTGIGEIYAASFGPHRIAELAREVAERHLLGEDPFRIERLWRRVYGRGYTGRPDPTLVGVLSGLEIACWDIVGKETGRPVHDLLGGRVHDRIRTYTYLYPSDDLPDVYDDPEQAAEAAVRYVEQGFTAVKLDPAVKYTIYDGRQPTLRELDRIERFLATIRDAVGDRADICVGTHGQYTAAGALRVAARIEPYEPLWFEEPVPPANPTEMARVATGTRVPVATGERLTTKDEFRTVLAAGAAGILQPNLGRAGGILETKKIAAMAEAHQVLIAPHLYAGPVLGAANIQLCACTPNFLIMEGIERWDGFQAELITPAIEWVDGDIIPPPGPGLGIELNDDVVRAHPWTGDELHIGPAEEPYHT